MGKVVPFSVRIEAVGELLRPEEGGREVVAAKPVTAPSGVMIVPDERRWMIIGAVPKLRLP